MVRIISRLTNHRSAYLVELPSHEEVHVRKPSKTLVVTAADWSNVNDVGQLRSPTVARTMRGLLVDGHLGAYAYLDGHFAGHFWARASGSGVVEMADGLKFGPDEVLLCWGWVGHALRGQGIFQSLIGFLVERVRSRHGRIRIVADVPCDPTTSLVAHTRMGFKLCGEFRSTKVLGRVVSSEQQALSHTELETIIGAHGR